VIIAPTRQLRAAEGKRRGEHHERQQLR